MSTELWIKCRCKQCDAIFQKKPWEVRQGRGQYCTHACAQLSRVGKPGRPKLAEPKQCEACSQEFLVGGRGNPPRKAKFCSLDCQRQSRFRNGSRSKSLSMSDASYLAGLIDGEGSIILYMRKTTVSAILTVTNTHKGVLDWVTETTGIGSVSCKVLDNPNHKAVYTWKTSSEAALTVLQQILPFLKIKPLQAELAIDTVSRLKVPALKADRSWHEEYYLRMKELNRRGPPQGGLDA